jgi:hypothetical protein
LGSVSAIQDQVSQALEQPVKTAQQYIHQQPVNQVNETVWPEGQKPKWMWIGATPLMTVFRILAGRGQAQAKEVSGNLVSSGNCAERSSMAESFYSRQPGLTLKSWERCTTNSFTIAH